MRNPNAEHGHILKKPAALLSQTDTVTRSGERFCFKFSRRSRVKILANQSMLPSVLFFNLLSAVG